MKIILPVVIALLLMISFLPASIAHVSASANPPIQGATITPRLVHPHAIDNSQHVVEKLPNRHSSSHSQNNKLLVTAPSIPSALQDPTLPIPGYSWNATSFSLATPTDGGIAVGPNNVVDIYNQAYQVFTKTGVGSGQVPLGILFNAPLSNGPCGSIEFDPDAIYDKTSGRFILETYGTDSLGFDGNLDGAICIAVSATSDPNGACNTYVFPNTVACDLLDFPHIAVTSDALFLENNIFDNCGTGLYTATGGFKNARVYAFDKTSMVAGLPSHYVFYNLTNDAAGSDQIASSLWPVQQVPTPSTGYFIATNECDSSPTCPSNLSVWKWTDPFGASNFSLVGGVNVDPYHSSDYPNGGLEPNNPLNPGQKLAVYSPDLLGASFYNNTIYAVGSTGCNPDNTGETTCLNWYQIGNIDSAPTILQSGLDGADQQSLFYPNLAVDQNGDVGIGYGYSSPTDYFSLGFTGRAASDPINTLETPQTIVHGTGNWNGRIGDYAGTALDPDGCTIWHFEEWMSGNPTAQFGNESLWIASFRFPSCTPNVPTPTPTNTSTNTVTNTPTNTATVTATFTNTSTVTNTSTPTNTVTSTATPTSTTTSTFTATKTNTPTPSFTTTNTATPTITSTATITPTVTVTPCQHAHKGCFTMVKR